MQIGDCVTDRRLACKSLKAVYLWFFIIHHSPSIYFTTVELVGLGDGL
jgi:hypothetical protein